MPADQNPIKPKSGVTLRVWEIADQITRERGRKATRKEVTSQAEGEGIHPGTARKQYNDWRVAYEDEQAGHPLTGFAEAPSLPFHLHLEVKPDGRVLIPADVRAMMKLDATGRLNAELIDGELRLFSPAVALEKMWHYAKVNDQGSGSTVDELIRERRVEAERE